MVRMIKNKFEWLLLRFKIQKLIVRVSLLHHIDFECFLKTKYLNIDDMKYYMES